MEANELIQFLQYQKPALEAGDYRIEVSQSIMIKDIKEDFPTANLDFTVAGDRFSLDQESVHTVYPPAGSLGRYTDCIPHVALTRSTLPWERSAYGKDDYEPWLALLLIDDEEIKSGQVIKSILTLKQLQEKSSQADEAKFPAVYSKNQSPLSHPFYGLESGQQLSDQVTVIDVKKSLLESIVPTGEELKLLSHVRKRTNSSLADPPDELAVIVCNRLPRPGSTSTLHLISVENRYDDNKNFYYQGAHANDYIRLVSLWSWSFSCPLSGGLSFEEHIEQLDTSILRFPVQSDNKSAEPFLARGYIPLFHKMRQGDQTYSWYHGPLGAGPVLTLFNNDADLPYYADSLIRYFETSGMFDVSYGAAFELGRVLALDDKLISAALYQWKQIYNESICRQEQAAETKSIIAPLADQSRQETVLEEKIRAWFAELALLKPVPFNYLVPDEKMLPLESIKFFNLDQHWLECLLYGAFSIGGHVRNNLAVENSLYSVFNDLSGQISSQARSGFILRSSLVEDYPDLICAGYAEKIATSEPIKTGTGQDKQFIPLDIIRLDRLANDVLFCLFDGYIQTAEIFLKPEGLRYGLDEEGGKLKKELLVETLFEGLKNNALHSLTIEKNLEQIMQAVQDKTLFDFTSAGCNPAQADGTRFEFPVAFREDNQTLRVLDIARLSDSLNTILVELAGAMTLLSRERLPHSVLSLTSAQIGMYLLEGSSKGRFVEK